MGRASPHGLGEQRNREVTYLPYVLQQPNTGLEWEAASQGFDVTSMPPIDMALDCVGQRKYEANSLFPGVARRVA